MEMTDLKYKMLGEEDVKKLISKLALPAIIGMLVSAIYNIVDTIFVGKLGTSAIGAVSVAFPLFMIIGAIGLTFGVGAGSYISRLMGQKNKHLADRTASLAFFTSMFCGIVFTVLGITFLKPVLRIFGATDTILPYAENYAKVIVAGSVFTMLNMSMNNILRAEGSPKESMIALSVGAGLNIILDPILMFSFNMGITGAALATVISQIVSTGLLLSYFIRGVSYTKISISNFKPSKKVYGEILKIGIPTFFAQFLNSIAMALINTAAAPYSDAAVASLGIVNRVLALAFYVLFGYSQGFQPVAGFNYGAKKFDRLDESIKISVKWSTTFTIFITFIFVIFSKNIVSVFSSDVNVIQIGSKSLRIISMFLPLLGFQVVYATLFQALGKGIPATILSLARQGLFLIPCILILPKIFGLNGVIFSQPIADLLTVILTFIFSIKLKKEIEYN